MTQAKPERRKTHGVLFFVVAFVIIAIITFVFREKPVIPWVEDYATGIQRSAELNKPALICFYWKAGPFSAAMRRGTWRNPEVFKFVTQTFVPILISIDDSPELAKTYGADYDGACFIRLQDGRQSDQATHGNRPPHEYIERIRTKLSEMTSKDS